MYIRFVVTNKDLGSGKRQGIFQALAEARDDGLLYQYEIDQAKEIHQWFNENLDKPSSFTRSSKPHALKVAISWYKDSAVEHIKHMREIALILESHGIHVDVIQTERPGYIVYEDEFQVTAEPFNETEA